MNEIRIEIRNETRTETRTEIRTETRTEIRNQLAIRIRQKIRPQKRPQKHQEIKYQSLQKYMQTKLQSYLQVLLQNILNPSLQKLRRNSPMTRLRIFSFVLVGLCVSSCSVYKSGARKLLESSGPPQGSIKTSSLKLLVVNQEVADFAELPSYEVCQLATAESVSCVQKLLCVEPEDERWSELSSAGQMSHVESSLLLDQEATPKNFEKNLLCHPL